MPKPIVGQFLAMEGGKAMSHRAIWFLLWVAAVRGQAQGPPGKPSGLFVIFIACGSLAAVFIAALLMIRCMEYTHSKLTGKSDDKYE
mmetsp:Transcript_2948/g.3322  ORF Transcript_2948/g.3322 Transcript_2948/m.3322 type:complete len:87 (+) Transcript_2948:25-285(+)|eukprot:Skav224111  [mRNA]  locus=scaffold2427:60688:63597:+ [translate_table: standard]